MNALKNKVQLIGNLGADPKVKTLDNGRSFATFTVATDDSYVKSDGTKVDGVQWHNVIAWGKLATHVQSYLTKGKRVLITGKLTSRAYESKDGSKRMYVEVVMQELMMLDAAPAKAA
jgi:single-strand DNA-binding protein